MTVPLQRLGRWVGQHLVLIGGLLVIVYMFVPIFVVVLMSFNKPEEQADLPLRLLHAAELAAPLRRREHVQRVCAAASRSGCWPRSSRRVLGTLMAFALVAAPLRRAGRRANLLIFLPMASPEIVMGSSLLALFVAAGFGGQLGFWTILIAHIMFCLSFVVVTVRARLAGLDNNLEQAAMDLYATEAQTFRRVTLPAGVPGHPGRGAAVVLAVLRRLHHHQPQRRQHHDVPDVRLGRRPARRTDAGQRGRHRDVRGLDRHRGRASSSTVGGRRRRSPDEPVRLERRGRARAAPARRRTGSTTRGRRRAAARRSTGPRRRRPGRRRRRLPRAVDGAAGQGARPRAATCSCSRPTTCGHAASGRNGGFCEASLTHGFGNGAGALARRDATRCSSWAARTSTASSATDRGSTTSTATSCAPGRWPSPTEPHQVDWLREEHAETRAHGLGTTWLDREELRARGWTPPTYLAGVARPGRRDARAGPAGLGAARRPASRSAYASVRARRVTGLSSAARQRRRAHRRPATVRADHVVLATNAYPPLLRRLRLMTVPVYDYALMTEPLTDGAARRRSGGAAGRASATRATSSTTTGTTRDGRILWGGYDAVYHYGSGIKAGVRRTARRRSRPSPSNFFSRRSPSSTASGSPTAGAA